MKKTIVFLIAILLFMGSVACGKENINTPDNTDVPDNIDIPDDTDKAEEPSIQNKMLDMPQIQIRPENPAGEVAMPSYEVEALLEVAEAYLSRMYATQYEDPHMTATGEYWFITNNASAGDMLKYSPESATSQNTYYTSCSPFIKDVFWQAWGENLTDADSWIAADIAKDKEFSYWSYSPTKKESDAQKTKIKAEFLSTLIPGDVIALCHKGYSGHILLYVGNGWAIHSNYYSSKDGGNYDQKENIAKTEIDGSVEYRDINTFFKEGNYYYFWDKEIWSILRPTEYLKDIKLTQQTKLRMENLRDIYEEKISSHPVGLTVQTGEEITYGFYLRNDRAEQASVELKDIIPDNTAYVSGAEKIDGKKLSWSVSLAPKEEKLICYTVKVNEDPNLYNNGIIKSNNATAGGVVLPCNDIYIAKKPDENGLKNLQNACMDLSQGTAKGIALAKELYQKAGLELNLPEADDLFASLFTVKNNFYSLNKNSEYYSMIVPRLYGGYRTNGEDEQKGTRNRFINYELMAGDIIVCCESSKVKVYMYAGDEKVVSLDVSGGKASIGKSHDRITQSVFGHDAYAVLRPYSK